MNKISGYPNELRKSAGIPTNKENQLVSQPKEKDNQNQQVSCEEYITWKIQMMAQKEITWKIQMIAQKDITWKIQMMAQMFFAMSVHHAPFKCPLEKKNGHGTSRPLQNEKWPEI
jgi:hypothetical protein